MSQQPLFRRLPWVTLPALIALVAMLAPGRAKAFEPYALQLPCRATAINEVGTERPCVTCHDNVNGGAGCLTSPCLNPFGLAFQGNGHLWTPALATGDADGDGYTNGEELGDPLGAWTFGQAEPGTCGCASRPGFPTFTPAEADADTDGYCCVGRDDNGDGDCIDESEHDTSFDCGPDDATVNSGVSEVCANTLDNDCDGLPTLQDPDCASVVDRDGDGFCETGRDTNGDQDCIDAGEATDDVDCNDDEITVFPGASESCSDALDNDCDGDVDRDDSACTGDNDADEDGYCPIGRDLNGDRDCLDPGEDVGDGDCDDMNAEAHPGQAEICTDSIDNDCDGVADSRDVADCAGVFDADGDGYCTEGRDDNGDGDCADGGEGDGSVDCDEGNAEVNPGATEICTNGLVDDDCDGQASLADSDCVTHLDTDHDRYCTVGFDLNEDGDCADEAEQIGAGDCDDANIELHPAATELCIDGLDNDCDGSIDARDLVGCPGYLDSDTDGYCLVGQDTNADGDCDDAGEQGDVRELSQAEDTVGGVGTEDDPTRYPGAPENCLDRVDNDLDGQIDEAAACVSDVDSDGDGYCPLGHDDNLDGDCLDPGENQAVSDCNDADETIHPGAEERCREIVDADCDGDFRTRDSDCFVLLDRDGDGFCPVGIDDNGDGDCEDADEDRFGADCDDQNRDIQPRAREACDDGIDNDCDGDIDLLDANCPCTTDAECDDGDACTTDICSTRSGDCSHEAIAECGSDGGALADGGTEVVPGGCNCRAMPSTGQSSPLLLLLVLVPLILRRRRC